MTKLHGKAGKLYLQGPSRRSVIAGGEWQLDTEGRFAMKKDDREDLITMILSALLKQAGGQIVLGESQLGEPDDRIVIDSDEASGLVTLTLIPDFVKTGIDSEPIRPNPTGVDFADFARRTVSGGWGTSNGGEAWSPTKPPVGSGGSYQLSSGGSLVPEAIFDEWQKALVKKVSDVYGVNNIAVKAKKTKKKKVGA